MRISVLTIGAIASIISTVALADTIVTSKNYVDTQDALKQDKITAGTTGNVVLYNGTQNGQTQFTGRAIYDGANDYDSTTDVDKLITAGAVDAMISSSTPEAPATMVATQRVCAEYDNNNDCILWDSVDIPVNVEHCSIDSDCNWYRDQVSDYCDAVWCDRGVCYCGLGQKFIW